MGKGVKMRVQCGDNITDLFKLPCVQQIRKLRKGAGYIVYLSSKPDKQIDLDAFRGNYIVEYNDGTWGVEHEI